MPREVLGNLLCSLLCPAHFLIGAADALRTLGIEVDQQPTVLDDVVVARGSVLASRYLKAVGLVAGLHNLITGVAAVLLNATSPPGIRAG